MFNKGDIKFISLTDANKMLQIDDEEMKLYKNKMERRINLNDSILMLLSSIEHNKKIISRTLMQREVFLFYEEILKHLDISKGAVEAGFFPYKYGPYSIDVNLALSTLIISGKIKITNYYQESNDELELSIVEKKQVKPLNKEKKKKFLTVFSTSEAFNEVASRYEKLLAEKEFSVESFQSLVQTKKQAWDQSTEKGITKLLVLTGFREWYKDRTIEESYPYIKFGKIAEEYKPRVKF